MHFQPDREGFESVVLLGCEITHFEYPYRKIHSPDVHKGGMKKTVDTSLPLHPFRDLANMARAQYLELRDRSIIGE